MERNELEQQPSFKYIKYAIDHLNTIPVSDPHRFELYQYLAGYIADEMVRMWKQMPEREMMFGLG